jgi:hypothetical protein
MEKERKLQSKKVLKEHTQIQCKLVAILPSKCPKCELILSKKWENTERFDMLAIVDYHN